MAARQLPQSADVRGAKFAIRDCDHIGPNTLKAIAATIQDARRQSTSQPSIDPSPLFIQYGELMIAGFAPQVAKARWPCGANAGSGPRGDLHPGDARRAPADGAPGSSVAAATGRAASPVAANDGLATHPQDPALRPAPVTLSQLKAALARGQFFAFLFLHYGGSATSVQPTAGDAARAGSADPTEVYAATAVGYDDQQEVFLVVKQAAEPCQQDGEIMMLSYSYWTHPVLSQDVWTVWKAMPQISA